MKHPKGQTLFEILVAMGIFAVVMGGAMILLNSQLQSLSSLRNRLRAMLLAEEGLEAARLIRDRSWSTLVPGTFGLSLINNTWEFQGNTDTTDGLTRRVTVADQAANERLVTANVEWTGPDSRTQTISLSTLLTDWRNITARLLSGDWQNPQTLGSIDLGAGTEGTSVAVQGGFVYITSEASDNKKNDFFVIDARDGRHPAIRGRLNTGNGLNAVAVLGTLAAAASQDSQGQLEIVNIANPDTPTLVSSLPLPGNNEEALSVGLSGTIALVGTEKDDQGSEFFVIDLTNPSAPQFRGSLEIDGDVNDISILGNTAFLATGRDSQELIILDLTNPSAPSQISAVDLPGASDAKSVYLNPQDNRVSLGRLTSGNPELVILYTSEPARPTILGSFDISNDVNSVFAADSLAFLATAQSNEEFQIYEVSNPANILHWSGLNFAQVAADIAFENNTIYVAARSNDALRIITSQ
ncbi:prepilin-type N-terminal cleavage/methylation domain-containing protein [Candidatus Uhrbacteria bacterium]|nr:prepilin-type N-terminal cleavage/methylation domain-containing protein [Candidatus Uhrbacteria bacterium]